MEEQNRSTKRTNVGAGVVGLMSPVKQAKIARSLLSGKNSRIGNGMAFVLIAISIVADLLTLIPFVGDFVGPAFWIFMAIYLWSAGCGWTNPEYLVTEVLSMVAEMIPAIQELPFLLLGTVIIIILVRLEDRTGIPVMKIVGEGGGKGPSNVNGVRAPSGSVPPLIKDGVRQPTGTASTMTDADSENGEQGARQMTENPRITNPTKPGIAAQDSSTPSEPKMPSMRDSDSQEDRGRKWNEYNEEKTLYEEYQERKREAGERMLKNYERLVSNGATDRVARGAASDQHRKEIEEIESWWREQIRRRANS